MAFAFGYVKIVSFNSQNTILPTLYNQFYDAFYFSFFILRNVNIKIIFFFFLIDFFSPFS